MYCLFSLYDDLFVVRPYSLLLMHNTINTHVILNVQRSNDYYTCIHEYIYSPLVLPTMTYHIWYTSTMWCFRDGRFLKWFSMFVATRDRLGGGGGQYKVNSKKNFLMLIVPVQWGFSCWMCHVQCVHIQKRLVHSH